MSNILDYLDWRGDVTFAGSPFNEIDGLIMSQLAYIPFDGIIDGGFTNAMTLKEAADIYFDTFKGNSESKLTLQMSNINELLSRASESERFRNIRGMFFVNKYDPDTALQFSASTWEIEPDRYVVAFRGTDDTIAGWEEDFDLCYKCPVGAQLESEKYLNKVFENLSGNIITLGHSKGGNLAIYSAIDLPMAYKLRLDKIYNYDGPGFLPEIIERPGYAEILGKISSYIPQASIVGMIMYNDDEINLVHSTNHGVLQHIAMSWQLMGKRFEKAEKLANTSKIFNAACKKWVCEIGSEEREVFVNILFQVLRASNTGTVSEFGANLIKASNSAFKSYNSLDKTTKKMVRNVTGQLIKLSGQSITENIGENLALKKSEAPAIEGPTDK